MRSPCGTPLAIIVFTSGTAFGKNLNDAATDSDNQRTTCVAVKGTTEKDVFFVIASADPAGPGESGHNLETFMEGIIGSG